MELKERINSLIEDFDNYPKALVPGMDYHQTLEQEWEDLLPKMWEFDLQMSKAYCEPGYEKTRPLEGQILFANWNDSPLAEFGDLSEKLGFDIEWSDEWSTCDNCSKAFRTLPDSYGWKGYYAYVDGCGVCGDCIKSDPYDYLYSLRNDPSRAITIEGIDPEDWNYRPISNQLYERGLHQGQNDSPDAILKVLNSAKIDSAIFQVVTSEQFCIKFRCLVASDDLEKAKLAIGEG
jgi:hypothetical protein